MEINYDPKPLAIHYVVSYHLKSHNWKLGKYLSMKWDIFAKIYSVSQYWQYLSSGLATLCLPVAAWRNVGFIIYVLQKYILFPIPVCWPPSTRTIFQYKQSSITQKFHLLAVKVAIISIEDIDVYFLKRIFFLLIYIHIVLNITFHSQIHLCLKLLTWIKIQLRRWKHTDEPFHRCLIEMLTGRIF